MASYESAIKKQQAIENNIFVRHVRQYESFNEYKKYNKTRYATYEEERNYIKEKVKYDMTKCTCSDTSDTRVRCNPITLRFRICPMRLDTAKWFISNEYAKIEDFNYFTEDEKEDLEFYMTIHPCDCCGRECSYYQDDTRGSCGTRGCCKIMCYRCAYNDGGDYYCEKCRDKMIENGVVDWEEQ